MSVRIAGFSGAIFINIDIILFSFIGLAVVPRNPELYISSVLAKLPDWKDGMLLGCRTRPPPSCLSRTGGVEELMRAVSPSAMVFSDPLLLTI